MARGSLSFEGFTLDLERICLWGPSGQADLRPKSFEVLRYLAEHPGRVVTKDEMLAAVWPDVIVTEDSLTRCISEVRRAIADEGQRIVKTVPRRGYLLDATVSFDEQRHKPPVARARPGAPAGTEPGGVAPGAGPHREIHLALGAGNAGDAALSREELAARLEVYRLREAALLDIFGRITSGAQDLTQTLRTVIAYALRLCEAEFGMLLLLGGEAFVYAAGINVPDAFESWCAGRPIVADPRTGLGQVKERREPVHVDDLQAEDLYRDGNDLRIATADLAGARTFMAIPILNEGRLLGALTIYRKEVRPFAPEQIGLVQAFALQAGLALANARLVEDLEARRRELAELNAALERRVEQQVVEIERHARLRRFVPPQLADLMLGEHPDRYLESHRSEVAVLCCDLRGFTALSEGVEPELVMGVLKDYHAAIGALCAIYEATLERFAGDRVMLLFNDPLPCPNPAERAVRLAVALRERIGTLAEGWRALELDLGFRTGVTYGYATLGQIGFEGRYDYAAVGPVPSLSAGLCDCAADGQVLVNQRVFAAVQDLVVTAPPESLQISGFARPIRAHAVLSLRDAASVGAPLPG